MDERHYSVIDPFKRRLTLKHNDVIIAQSENAFIMKEVGSGVYNPVYYFPKEDLKVELSIEESRQSTCPIKGAATYWNYSDTPTSDYFAWSYETPNPRSKKIAGYIAFNEAETTLISEPL